jgi:hypothetical protein
MGQNMPVKVSRQQKKLQYISATTYYMQTLPRKKLNAATGALLGDPNLVPGPSGPNLLLQPMIW